MPYRSSLCLMAGMVRERAISPVELVEAHLGQIERENPRINAFVRVMADEARAAASKAETDVARGDFHGILQGVPVTVKDSFDVLGFPTLAGSRLRLGHHASQDAAAVARLKAEGAIVLGKTNCPELLSSYETDNHVAGRTNNPWNVERTPGGSSGGEAAAIAAFCSPGGIGSDGGGSIRVPAHFCGIAGFKPTPGRISIAGHFPAAGHPAGFVLSAGPMARTAEDLRLLFAALVGYDMRDPFSVPVPLHPPGRRKFRVGLVPRFYEVPVQPAVANAVENAARLLAAAGYAVEPFAPRGLERAPNLWWLFFGQLPAPFTRRLLEGREQDAHWTLTDSLRLALEDPPTLERVMTGFAARDAMRAALLRHMEDVPVLLTPVSGIAAFEHGARSWPAGGQSIGLFQAMMPSVVWNLLGFPAISLPVTVSPEGLPIGVQLVGRPWEDELLLEIAVEFEEARGPFPLQGGTEDKSSRGTARQ